MNIFRIDRNKTIVSALPAFSWRAYTFLLLPGLVWLSPAILGLINRAPASDELTIDCPPPITVDYESAPICLEFEDFSAGAIVDEIDTRFGVVQVQARSNRFPDQNAGMVFDSDNPTGKDTDLGSPNQDFGGPGIGKGGGADTPFRLDKAQGNVLIISKNLNPADPNDDEKGGTIEFDFSEFEHGVTLHSLELVDLEKPASIDLLDTTGIFIKTIALNPAGNNGFLTVDLEGTQHVGSFKIHLSESASVDKLCFSKGVPLGSGKAESSCDEDVTVSFTDKIIPGVCAGAFTIERTYRALDACGNEATCLQIITVTNATPPKILNCSPEPTDLGCNPTVFPPPIVLEVATFPGEKIDTLITADTIVQGCNSLFTRTYIVENECGLRDTCTEQFSFSLDTIAPEFPNTEDSLVCVDQLPSFNPSSFEVTDQGCGGITLSVKDSVGFSALCDSVVFRVITATDACGNNSNLIQRFSLCLICRNQNGICPPDLDLGCNPTDIPLPLTTIGNDSVQFPATLILEDTLLHGCQVTLVRTYSFDSGSQIDTCVQWISYVDDPIPPSIAVSSLDTTVCPDDPLIRNPEIGGVSINDACGLVQVRTTDQRDTLPDGTIVINRTYLAEDGCENKTEATQRITVRGDTTGCDSNDCPTDIAFINLEVLDSIPSMISCGSSIPAQPDLFYINSLGDTVAADKDLSFLPDTCGYVITYRWTAKDNTCEGGNELSQVLLVEVKPVLPVLQVPESDTISCDSLTTNRIEYSNGQTGLCAISGSVESTLTLIRGTVDCPEAYLESWSAIICEDTVEASRTILIKNGPIQVNCPDTLFLFGSDTIPPPDSSAITFAGACGPVSVTLIETNFDTTRNDTGAIAFITIERTFEVRDACGNLGQCSRIIIQYPPAPAPWTCELTNLALGCDPIEIPAPVTPDSTGYSLIYELIEQDTLTEGCKVELKRAYRVSSLTQVLGSCTQTLSWQSSELTPPPVVQCPPDTVLVGLNALPGIDTGLLVVSGGCLTDAYTVTVQSDTIPGMSGNTIVQRTYTVADNCGQTSSCTQTFTIIPETPLSRLFRVDAINQCNPDSIPGPVTDADIPPGLNISISNFEEDTITTGCAIELVRTYTVERLGLSDTTIFQSLNWTLDTIPPTVISCPANQTYTGSIPGYDPDSLVFDDNCGIVEIRTSKRIDTLDCGAFQFTRIFIAEDLCGNTTSCEQVLTCYECNFPCQLPADTLEVCPGGTIALNPGAEGESCQYQWEPSDVLSDPMAPNPTLTMPDSGQVKLNLTVTTPDGQCSIEKTVIVLPVSVVELQAPEMVPSCGSPVTLRATSAIPDAEFSWSDEPDFNILLGFEDSLVVNPSGMTTYYVRAEANNCMETQEIQVALNPLNLSVNAPKLCFVPDIVELTVLNLNPSQQLSFDWLNDSLLESDDGQAEARFLLQHAEDLKVVVQNEFGCLDTLTSEIRLVDLTDKLIVSADPDTIFAGQNSSLVAAGCETCMYNWNPPNSLTNSRVSNPSANPLETTQYTVTTSVEGCVLSDTITVFVIELCDGETVFVPNTFTPSASPGVNDYFRPRGRLFDEKLVDEYNFIIYSPWGQAVFNTNNPEDQGWDGTFRGEQLEPGTFGYYLEFKCPGGDRIRKQGNVTLIR